MKRTLQDVHNVGRFIKDARLHSGGFRFPMDGDRIQQAPMGTLGDFGPNALGEQLELFPMAISDALFASAGAVPMTFDSLFPQIVKVWVDPAWIIPPGPV
jgi:hypothetical protein